MSCRGCNDDGERELTADFRDRYFDGGYFLPGNEPSFETPWLYQYANRPDLSARRVRKVVYENFGTGVEGVR